MDAPEYLATCCGIGILAAIFGTIMAILLIWGYISQKRLQAFMKDLALSLGCKYENNAITGEYRNHRISIDYPVRQHTHYTGKGTRTDTTYYTRIQVSHKGQIDGQIEVYKQGFLSTIGKALGMQDIQVGNREFDKTFIVKGKNEARVKQILDPEVQQKMLQLKIPLVIKPDQIFHEVEGQNKDKQKIIDTLSLMTQLAENTEK